MTALSVVGLIWFNGSVLAVSRRGRPDDLCLPGGKVDGDELPEFALPREVKEETGIIVMSFRLLYEAPSSDPGVLVKLYEVGEYCGDSREMEAGITPQWVPFGRLCRPCNTFHRFYSEFDRWLGNRIMENGRRRSLYL